MLTSVWVAQVTRVVKKDDMSQRKPQDHGGFSSATYVFVAYPASLSQLV